MGQVKPEIATYRFPRQSAAGTFRVFFFRYNKALYHHQKSQNLLSYTFSRKLDTIKISGQKMYC